MVIHSVSTIATISVYKELCLMLRTLDQFHSLPVFVRCDPPTESRIKTETWNNLSVFASAANEMKESRQQESSWVDLMKWKMNVMEWAITETGNTLFVDADVMFLNPLSLIFKDSELLLSRHFIDDAVEARFGKFNAGYLATCHHAFPQWWREALPRSCYLEQQCLDFATDRFVCNELPITHNFGWWRIHNVKFHESRLRQRALRVVDGVPHYNEEPLISVHSHFGNRSPSVQRFNAVIKRLLEQSRHNFYRWVSTQI